MLVTVGSTGLIYRASTEKDHSPVTTAIETYVHCTTNVANQERMMWKYVGYNSDDILQW